MPPPTEHNDELRILSKRRGGMKGVGSDLQEFIVPLLVSKRYKDRTGLGFQTHSRRVQTGVGSGEGLNVTQINKSAESGDPITRENKRSYIGSRSYL